MDKAHNKSLKTDEWKLYFLLLSIYFRQSWFWNHRHLYFMNIQAWVFSDFIQFADVVFCNNAWKPKITINEVNLMPANFSIVDNDIQ